jgi:hypothetical protein
MILNHDLISSFQHMSPDDFNSKYGQVHIAEIDGSSRFIEETWDNFWSLGGRWNIDEEECNSKLDV